MSEGETGTPKTGENWVVVGVDGSACATRALDFAVREAAHWGAVVHVVSVYRVLPSQGGVVVPMGLFEESAQAIVSGSFRRAVELEPDVVVKGEAVLGAPGPELVRMSEGATALVVGTRGRSQLAGILLGSVSEYAVHHGTCTTIVVR